jgi:hypothetical protein
LSALRRRHVGGTGDHDCAERSVSGSTNDLVQPKFPRAASCRMSLSSRLKDLELENSRLRKAVSDLTPPIIRHLADAASRMAWRDPIAGQAPCVCRAHWPDTDRPGSYFLVYRWRSVRASGLSSVSFLTRDHSDLPVPVSGNRHINETVTFLQRSILFESASHFKTNFRFLCRPRTTTGAVRA